MNILIRFMIIFSLLFLISCSASYEKINNKDFIINDELSRYIFEEYKEKAKFEANEMHDWNSVKLYSEKALDAVKEKKVFPEKTSYWKLSGDKKSEILMSYNNLMAIYDEAALLDPFNL